MTIMKRSLSTMPRWICGLVFVLTAVAAWAADEPNPDIVRFMTTWGKQGSGPGEFNIPIGIAINAADEVYVTDHYNDRVQKFDADGHWLAQLPVLPHPGGIAIDAEGKLYIGHFPAARGTKETTPDRVTVYDGAGKLLQEWGKSGAGDGEFSWVGGIAVAKNGEVFVADQTNRRMQVFDRSGKFLRKWGRYGTKPGEFGGNVTPKSRVGGPQFVAIDSAGDIFTTEASVGRVQKFTPQGEFLLQWGDNQVKPGSFGGEFTPIKSSLIGPIGICVDHQDRLWVTSVGGRIQLFTRDGKYLGGFGEKSGTGQGEFLAPHGVALNGHGQLYVVDTYNHRVQKFEVLK
jgi:DNA-binding beta-propeller fold protein YncE